MLIYSRVLKEAIVANAEGGEAVKAIDRSDSFLARKIFNMLDAGFKPGDLSLSAELRSETDATE